MFGCLNKTGRYKTLPLQILFAGMWKFNLESAQADGVKIAQRFIVGQTTKNIRVPQGTKENRSVSFVPCGTLAYLVFVFPTINRRAINEASLRD